MTKEVRKTLRNKEKEDRRKERHEGRKEREKWGRKGIRNCRD